MIKEAIVKLSKKEDLTFAEAREVMNEIMNGQASGVQMAAYLTALSLKGETTDEITASAVGMREHCIRLLHDVDALEIVGTGGDHANSFNISTTAALVTAAGGVAVAKHGNRAASSKCGAADVLEALGVNITISPERSAQLLKEINICFLFAQNYHIAMKYVAPVRRELGIRTVFNILGPLSNPAGAKRELMGVYDETLVEPLAHVMSRLGVSRGMVVFGQDSHDPVSRIRKFSIAACEKIVYKPLGLYRRPYRRSAHSTQPGKSVSQRRKHVLPGRNMVIGQSQNQVRQHLFHACFIRRIAFGNAFHDHGIHTLRLYVESEFRQDVSVL